MQAAQRAKVNRCRADFMADGLIIVLPMRKPGVAGPVLGASAKSNNVRAEG